MKALVGVILAAVVVAACGGGGSTFPDEAACAAPSPLPTSRAQPGVVSADAYFRRLQGFATNLERLRAAERVKYNEDTFYRRDEFRPDFAMYASQTVCTAQIMLDLEPPDARFAEYDATLDAALTELIAHTRAGREAVKKRNVSDYRDWYAGADRKIADVRAAAYAQQ